MQKNDHQFGSLRRSERVEVRGAGLFAAEDIPALSILLSINQRDTICFSTIAGWFKKRTQWLKGKRVMSSSTHIEKQLDYQNEVLMLYLIYLRRKGESQITRQWFGRPLEAMYFFDRRIIQQSQNLDLLIDYVAEHNYLSEVSLFMFGQLGPEGLALLFGVQSVSYEQFKNSYVWSYHFLNNRSFGYTRQYTLIPLFDMINHSVVNANVSQLLSDLQRPSHQELQRLKQRQRDQFQSDNEESEQQVDKVLLSQSFYYHVISTSPILAGEQIFIQYGNRNNKFLMQGYGFVESLNPYDSLTIFVSQNSEDIFYDSVKGQGASPYKLKRGVFHFGMFLDFKKKYYEEYYHKDNRKAKILWTKPKDKGFELFFIEKIVARLEKNAPKRHIFEKGLCGAAQLEKYEHEQFSIFKQQLYYYQKLKWQISKAGLVGQSVQGSFGVQDAIVPQNLREYLSFLSVL